MKTENFRFATALSVALTGTSNFALAQEGGTATQRKELRDVVVSVSRSQAKVEQMPLHTTVVTQEEIQRSPAQTLDQLLGTLPGLNFTRVPATQADPTSHQTRMRGLGNSKVLVLLDGVPIMDPFYLTTQWYKVPLSNVERVEIVRGGNSSLWGNMAVAGVINIVSKRPKDGSGEASLQWGSRGSGKLSLSKNFAPSEGVGINLSVDHFKAEGYETVLPDQAWRYAGRGAAEAQNSSLRLATYLKPSADLSGYLRVGAHVQDQDLGYQFSNARQFSPDAAASLTKTFADQGSLTTTAWAQYVRFDKYNGAGCYWQATGTRCPAVNAVTPAQVNNQVVQYYTQRGVQRYREQGASAIYAKDIGRVWQSVQVGLDWRHLSASDDEQFFAAPTTLARLQNLSSATYGKGDQTFTGLFAQTRITPTERLALTFSGRYDAWKNDQRVNTRTSSAGLTTGGPQPDTSKSAFNPSAALRYALGDDWALRGAIYKSFRAPGFNNMTRTYGSPSPTVANPNLGPEDLRGRELGFDWGTGALSVSATYFRYDIENMIATYKVTRANAPALVQTLCGGATLPQCNGSASFYTNDQDGRSDGIELTATWHAAPTLAFDASYTHTRSELTRKGYVSNDPIGVQLAGLPKNVVHLGVAWQPVAGLRTYLQAHHTGRMYVDTTTVAGNYYSQGSVTVFDASAAYRVNETVELLASVQNLLNKQYSENAYTYNRPWERVLSLPRTVYAGMKVRF